MADATTPRNGSVDGPPGKAWADGVQDGAATNVARARLAGRVAKVLYRSPDNRFHVLAVAPDGAGLPCTAVSRGVPVWAGQAVEMTGTWGIDPQHGERFMADRTTTGTPATEAGLKAYLASGAFRKVGKVTADRLVRSFGTGIGRIIEADPDRLAQLPGISKAFARKLRDDWRAGEPAARDDEVFLRSIGMTTSQMAALRRAHGAAGAKLVQADPYMLTHSVRGIGFKRADDLATGMGMAPEEAVRVTAGLSEALRLASKDKGHCLLPERELVRQATALLGVGMARVAEVLDDVDPSLLERMATPAGPCRALPRLAMQERRIAEILLRLAGGTPPWRIADPAAALRAADAATGKPLSDGQRAAFLGVLASRVAIVTGGPGVGKTTLLRSLLHAIGGAGCKVRQSAPTGRAAMNMMDATGIDADTIHLILGRSDDAAGFRHHRGNPLDCDLMVVDETSMGDVPLLHALLDAIPDRAGLLMIGDVDQLEPVGPGRPFGDAIDSGRIPVFRLTEIRRQAAGSRIVTACHDIRAGRVPDLETDPARSDFLFYRVKDEAAIAERIVDLAARGLPNLLGIHPIQDVQVLSPMNVRNLGTEHLQPMLRAALNPGADERVANAWADFGLGDKVLHTKNNYRIGVRNGEIGLVRAIDPKAGTVAVEYGRRTVQYDAEAMAELRLGYAVTVHKSQGSEYQAVVMPVVLGHQFMLRRRLINTAFSRARRMLVAVGHVDALAKAVADTRTEPRHTQLRALLETA